MTQLGCFTTCALASDLALASLEGQIFILVKRLDALEQTVPAPDPRPDLVLHLSVL